MQRTLKNIRPKQSRSPGAPVACGGEASAYKVGPPDGKIVSVGHSGSLEARHWLSRRNVEVDRLQNSASTMVGVIILALCFSVTVRCQPIRTQR